ncbi:hypothetical protein RUND412_007136 [Rhizina undulata]
MAEKVYRPVNIGFLGQQKVGVPFPRGQLSIPLTKTPPRYLTDFSYGRNNLIVASKRRNHLYVAMGSRIYVYAPIYPKQHIPKTNPPLHILTSDPPQPKRGYIDPQNPHAINSLTIGDLGVEEVLVSAHDDGDVCVWYTRDLSRLALRLSVGISAWGVAIHKERRLLAVSANSFEISVFELGVSDAVDSEEETRGRGKHKDEKAKGKARKSDVSVTGKTVRVLRGHSSNIPNISFLDDTTGRWLAGTSIDGMLIVWDVLKERICSRCRMGYAQGWGVLCLKPQAFKPVNNLYEALGKKPEPRQNGKTPTSAPPKRHEDGIQTLGSGAASFYNNRAYLWDISPSAQGHPRRADGQETLLQMAMQQILWDHGDDDDYDDDGDDDDYDDDGGYYENDLDGIMNENVSVEGETAETPPTQTDSSPLLEGVYGLVEQGEDSNLDTNNNQYPESAEAEAEAESESESESGSESESESESGSESPRPELISPESDDEATISYEEHPENGCIIIQTTQHNVYLLPAHPFSPTVICKSPLRLQPMPMSLQYISHLDRLNMVFHIPGLSLVIAASPFGRAAVFRLTRSGDVFAMRLEDVLPREGTDRDVASRPKAELAGIGVGPVQGRMEGRRRSGDWRGCERRRRWRVMMVYKDGGVLSYELGREDRGEDGLGGYVMI